eukprot:superscaffoldBa00010515_g24750
MLCRSVGFIVKCQPEAAVGVILSNLTSLFSAAAERSFSSQSSQSDSTGSVSRDRNLQTGPHRTPTDWTRDPHRPDPRPKKDQRPETGSETRDRIR